MWNKWFKKKKLKWYNKKWIKRIYLLTNKMKWNKSFKGYNLKENQILVKRKIKLNCGKMD